MLSRFWKLFLRALRWKCPVCGKGDLFRSGLTMHEKCGACGVKFEREPGFFLGSIYFNYGLTALLAIIVYGTLYAQGLTRSHSLECQVGLLIFVLIFPLFFHRHARSLWLGFDQWHDRQEGEK